MWPKASKRRLHHAVDVAHAADVGGYDEGARADVLEFGREGAEAVFAAGGESDAGAAAGEGERGLAADAAAGAGDDD